MINSPFLLIKSKLFFIFENSYIEYINRFPLLYFLELLLCIPNNF